MFSFQSVEIFIALNMAVCGNIRDGFTLLANTAVFVVLKFEINLIKHMVSLNKLTIKTFFFKLIIKALGESLTIIKSFS